jgi:hypothetical protein
MFLCLKLGDGKDEKYAIMQERPTMSSREKKREKVWEP